MAGRPCRVCVLCVCDVAIAMCARAFSVSFNPLIYAYPQRKKIYKMEMRAQQGILRYEMNDRCTVIAHVWDGA